MARLSAPANSPQVAVVPTPGLGNSTYLVADGDSAVVIDVPRDAWRVAEVAEARGWRITHALETHVHNDYLSGARELSSSSDVTIVAPAKGGYGFSHLAAAEGFEVPLGDFGLVGRATPGHTPEHLSWEVRGGDGRPLALFSGGSLLIGGVGRTDLLGQARTAELTEAQFGTVRRLAEMPDDVVVYPTHGAGSFCVAGDADGPGSATIGALRRWNPAMAAADLETFSREVAVGRTLYPAYYRRMAPLNRRGARLLGGAWTSHPLTVAEVVSARDAGVWMIDVRDRWAFADRHITGSWNIELGDSLSSYVGWLLPFDAPICLIVDDPVQEIDAAAELMRIGYDHVVGHLHGGMDAWAAAGGATRSYATAGWEELRSFAAGEGGEAAQILDVRQPYEWKQGSIPGSKRIFVADLPAAMAELDRDVTWLVACRTGARASIAASLLDAAGVSARPVVDGGVPALPHHELRPSGD